MTDKPASFIPSQPRLVHLDLLRGIAALGVVVGHIRSFVLVDYGAAEHSFLIVVCYFLTSLGHQCVIAFFALSGFLVGGQALHNISRGSWSVVGYLVRRLARLWVVLLPALLLTFGLDTAGRLLGGGAGYDGAFYHLVNAGPSPQSPADWGATTLIGNIMFLQTVMVPVFGSNGPLWSLANEFWYYVTFPFIFAAVLGKQFTLTRVLSGALGVVLLLVLPGDLVALGGTWILGALAGCAARLENWPRRTWFLVLATATVTAAAGALFLSKRWPGVPTDLLLGGAFACLLPILARSKNVGALYNAVANSTANISYTLYATHFPVLAFIWFVFFAPRKFQLDLSAALVMSAMLIGALSIAVLMWWVFERNTDRIRTVVESYVSPSRVKTLKT